MTRKLPEGVIKGVCQLMSDTEVPELFSLWGGVVAVSSALGRHCFVDQGHFVVYPNLYVVLVAGSAQCRKSTIINTIDDLISSMENAPNKISQKCTPEALIGHLSETAEIDESRVIPNASGIAIVDELSTLIDKNAFYSGMIAVLTKLYDCKNFDYRTRSRGIEVVQNPCLSIFGGSTLHWIKESIPEVSIGGGFTARVIFIFRDKKKQFVPWPVRTNETLQLTDAIVHDLNTIQEKLRGRFAVTKNAIELYSDQYIEFCKTSELFGNPNMAGYAGRRHAIVLKLAMCFSASIKDTREIDEKDMAQAILALSRAEEDMPQVLSAISASPTGQLSDELIHFLYRKQRCTRRELINFFRHKLTGGEIDILMKDLADGGIIKLEIQPNGNTHYVWVKKEKDDG